MVNLYYLLLFHYEIKEIKANFMLLWFNKELLTLELSSNNKLFFQGMTNGCSFGVIISIMWLERKMKKIYQN